MKCAISLVICIFVTVTQSNEAWLDDMDHMDQFQLDQLLDRHYSQQINNLVDLDAAQADDTSENLGHLYENANDFYFDKDQLQYIYDEDDDTDDGDTDYYEDEYYNEYYDSDDDDDDAYYDDEDDAYYDDDSDDAYYDDDDDDSDYKSMNWMDQYFDELDEFYYNSYRLHTTYDDFENMDFSRVLQHHTDTKHDDDDGSYIQELLSSLHQENKPNLATLETKEKNSKTASTKERDTKSNTQRGTFINKKANLYRNNVLLEASKNHVVIAMILRSYMMYLRTAAHLQGKMKGTKGLRALPSDLQSLCKGDFGALDMNQVRVAMGVNTLHGDPVTFGCDIFFPRVLDIKNDKSDLELLLTQMKYAQMYTEQGGIWPFLEAHVMNVCPDRENCAIFQKIVRQRSLDLMDIVSLDKTVKMALKMEVNKIWHQYGSLVRKTDASAINEAEQKVPVVTKKIKVHSFPEKDRA